MKRQFALHYLEGFPVLSEKHVPRDPQDLSLFCHPKGQSQHDEVRHTASIWFALASNVPRGNMNTSTAQARCYETHHEAKQKGKANATSIWIARTPLIMLKTTHKGATDHILVRLQQCPS